MEFAVGKLGVVLGQIAGLVVVQSLEVERGCWKVFGGDVVSGLLNILPIPKVEIGHIVNVTIVEGIRVLRCIQRVFLEDGRYAVQASNARFFITNIWVLLQVIHCLVVRNVYRHQLVINVDGLHRSENVL